MIGVYTNISHILHISHISHFVILSSANDNCHKDVTRSSRPIRSSRPNIMFMIYIAIIHRELYVV